MIEFVVPGQPLSKARPRHGRGRRVYTPSTTRLAENTVAWYARAAGATFGRELVAVQIDFYESARRGDIDNKAKLVLDGLQKGGAFANDSQVVELRLRRSSVAKGAEQTAIRIWNADEERSAA